MNLNQLSIPSLDLEKSVPFYEKLGLRLIVKSLPHYARFECPDGASTFSIHKVEKLPGESTKRPLIKVLTFLPQKMADIKESKIAFVAPIARAVSGASVGDRMPLRMGRVEVAEISYGKD